uniref:Uncharacterized protein n=1 Tax=Fagus sylvatica TaxID=28930 RepID=A0A2N9HZY5_FAGSY
MPPKPRQRRKQREVSAHMEHSQAESAVNAQGQNPPPPPPSDPNPEAPPTNLLLELIQSLQQNQSELAEAIKQLKEKDAGTKTPPQNEGGDQEKPHEDSDSHGKEATFVTMSDVADLLKQEREKNPKESRLFVRKPPYPAELLKQPYPEKYIAPTFSRFDGQKGSALVHISKFVDSMGAYAGNGDLCLREFSKSLDDRAYTWYTTLPPGSVKVWEDMVELFCGKYFQAEEKITLVNLHTTKQASGEDLLHYIHRFRDISLDCYANYEEGELVGVCIDNMLPEFRAHLENLDISRFGQLLQKARKTVLSVKPHTEKPKEKKNQPQVLTVSTVSNKRKKSNERSFDEAPPPVPCTLEEMKAILDKWVADGIIKLPEAQKKATEEDKKNPKFCYFHRYVHHSTADCWTLRRKFHEKIQDGTLELPQVQQKVHTDPFLKHKDRAVVSVVIHGSTSDVDVDESATASTAMTPTAIKTLQRNPRFRSLFNQLGLNLEARTAATEAIMAIAADSGAHCFTAETHASRAFLETTNAITFTDEDMEVQYPDHRRPLYLSATINEVQVRRALVDNGSCINLIPLSTIQAAEIPQKKIQGAPMEIKWFRWSLYDEVTPAVGSIACQTHWNSTAQMGRNKGCSWGGFERSARNRKRSARQKLVPARVNHNVYASVYRMDALFTACEDAAEPVAADPKISAKEELEVIDLSSDPSVHKPVSISASLSVEERMHLVELLKEYQDVFAWQYDEMPGIDPKLVAHSLNVEPGTKPVVQPMRTFHPGSRSSNHSRSQEATFSWDAEKTAFRTPIGNFYYTVMPFGLKNAGATYQRTMTAMFHDMMHCEIEDYVDDIMVKFQDKGRSFWYLEEMHQRGIDVDPARASAIATMKPPTTHKELKSFLGKLSYIRRFIPGLAAVTSTFAPLLKKGAPFHWSTECQEAFEKPKKMIMGMNNPSIMLAVLSRMPKADTQGAERSCLALIYASQRLRHYFLAHKWLLQLSQYEIIAETPTAIKSQAIADLLAQFPGEDNSSISDEVPGEINEVFLAGLADSVWTLKFDGSSTATSAGAGIILYRDDGEVVTKSFKFDFPCSNNAVEYEAYLAGLAIAYEMGIKHLRVIGDSNLVVCQARGEFSLKEPSLVPYRALAQKLEAKFSTFEIEHAQRNENRYADALATLGSQIAFEGEEMDVTICKKTKPITESLRKEFEELSQDQEDWRAPIKAKLMSPAVTADLREIKDYTLISGDLYRRLPGGVLASYISIEEAKEKLPDVHEKTCGDGGAISLYRRLQRLGYFLAKHELALRYFVEGGTLFRKGFHGEPLRCLSEKAFGMESRLDGLMKDRTHAGECVMKEHPGNGKKRLYQCLLTTWLLTLGYTLAYNEEGCGRFCENMPYLPSPSQLDPYSPPTSLQNMATPWPFHTWGLDLIGPINPASGGYIWILVATEYFTKWVEAIPLRKATGAAVANFIREHRQSLLITDNGTPFINKDVREVLEHYRVKHRRSTPYYPQGNGQAEATNRMLLRILSKMVFDYGNDWKAHLADVLWAYRSSPKTAIGFTPFSLVYGTDTISPTELVMPSPRVMQGSELEVDANMCAEARMADLEGLGEARDLAKAKSQRNYQKMANVYSKALRVRIFAEGQMVLKAAEFVRRNLPSPSKFSPNWDGPYIIREAHGSGYYRLSKSDGTTLADPINGKWLKHYYS